MERLQNELAHLQQRLCPTADQNQARQQLIDLIESIFQQHDAQAKIVCFGSFATQMHLPNSDLDLCIRSEWICSVHTMGNILAKAEQKLKIAMLQVIFRARIPIVKFVATESELEVDLSRFRQAALDTKQVVDTLRQQYSPHYVNLVKLLKFALKKKGMMDVRNGYMGSYTLCLMAGAYFMQRFGAARPAEIAADKEGASAAAGASGGPLNDAQIFRDFLDMFVYRFDCSRNKIVLNLQTFTVRYDTKYDTLDHSPWIVDPADSKNLVGHQSYKYYTIEALFKKWLQIIDSEIAKSSDLAESSDTKYTSYTNTNFCILNQIISF